MSATSSSLGLADLALVWDEQRGDADLILIDQDLASDAGLETAVILSLFLDRRAENDDKPPSGDASDRRGWWADQFSDVEGDRIGSRLWLLDRSVRTTDTALRAEQYTREALQWLLDDRVVASVDVEIDISSPQTLAITVTLTRPARDPVTFRYQRVWDAFAA